MSISKKISILFFISFVLMSIIGLWIDNINSQRVQSLVKDKYLEIASELYTNIENESFINQLIKEHKLKKLDSMEKGSKEVLYEKKHTFGFISIFQISLEDEFIIHLKYLDEEYILKTKDEKNLSEKFTLNLLIFLDIFVLILIFLYILKLLNPLKKITSEIKSFSKGDLSRRVKINSKDEIGILANSFNNMASNLEELITTREELLRDIGHELRTPIAKGKFAIEKLEETDNKTLLKKIFFDLESLTNELIQLEKLKSSKLNLTQFSADTLVLEALDKLYIDNEEKVTLNILKSFKIKGDLNYLSTAIKNLIDNALKYSTSYPIEIKIDNNEIVISNFGKKLSKNIKYYLRPFTQELQQRNGFGLGLSIVKKILDRHNFKLNYFYKNKKNSFVVSFSLKEYPLNY